MSMAGAQKRTWKRYQGLGVGCGQHTAAEGSVLGAWGFLPFPWLAKSWDILSCREATGIMDPVPGPAQTPNNRTLHPWGCCPNPSGALAASGLCSFPGGSEELVENAGNNKNCSFAELLSVSAIPSERCSEIPFPQLLSFSRCTGCATSTQRGSKEKPVMLLYLRHHCTSQGCSHLQFGSCNCSLPPSASWPAAAGAGKSCKGSLV